MAAREFESHSAAEGLRFTET